MRTAVAGVGLVWAIGASSVVAATQGDAVLTSGDLQVRVSARTGDLVAVRYRTRDLLSAPATVQLHAHDKKGNRSTALRPGQVTQFTATPTRVHYVRQWAGAQTTGEITLSSDGVRWLVTATGPAPVRQLTVVYTVPCLAGAERVFWAAAGAPFKAADKPRGFKYAYQSALPLTTLYSETHDVGLTAVAPLELKKPDLTVDFDWSAGTVGFSYRHLRLGQPYQARTGLWLVGHAGCWRPALGAMLRRYPSYFESHPRVLAGEGLYAGCYLRYDPKGKAYPERWARLGASWVESHSFWPFQGLYQPERDPWIAIMPKDRQKPADLIVWEQHKEKGVTLSRQWVRDYIRTFHKRGIQYYSYMNTTEAWTPYANRCFADAIVQRFAAPAYGGLALMSAYGNTSWASTSASRCGAASNGSPNRTGCSSTRTATAPGISAPTTGSAW